MKLNIIKYIINKFKEKRRWKYISAWILQGRLFVGKENFPISLSDCEREFLINVSKNCSSYLEFGSGGSTYLMLKYTNIPKITSVESSVEWLNHLRHFSIISDNENARLKLVYIDIGKTGQWGWPLEYQKKQQFVNYSMFPFINDKKYDFIFIDGRFRVACALQVILNCDMDTKILIHDFNMREKYHVILEFTDVIDTADSMILLKIKKQIDKVKVAKMYEEYKYICE